VASRLRQTELGGVRQEKAGWQASRQTSSQVLSRYCASKAESERGMKEKE
jgi:hypothetical protein